MKILTNLLPLLVLLTNSVALAETVIPRKSQTSETIQADISTCHAQADSQHPTASPVPVGGRIRGATTGAVAGAATAQVRGRQYDQAYEHIDNDVKQDYRQNQARSTAAAGMVVGAAKQRQDRRHHLNASEQSITANKSVYTTCLQQRGYDVLQ